MNNYAKELCQAANQGQKLASLISIAMTNLTEQVALINEAISILIRLLFKLIV